MSFLNDAGSINSVDKVGRTEKASKASADLKRENAQIDIGKKRVSLTDRATNEKVEELFKKYHKPLLSFIRNQSSFDEEAAKEVAQETFISLARHIKAGGSLEHERGLIHKIAKTKLIDFHRRSTVRMQSAHVELEDHSAASKEPSHERILDSEQRLAQLEQVVLTLPPKCQEVFVLRAFEEMKYDEIAARCGISQSMVEKHLNKAFRIVREKMKYKA